MAGAVSGGYEVLLVVTCGTCAGERRQEPKLAETRRYVGGRVNWVTFDRRRARDVRSRGQETPGGNIRTIDALIVPGLDVDVPDFLDVYCDRHGPGRADASDVVGKHGRLRVTI